MDKPIEEEVPKYRKKAQKKSFKKANHKHEWTNCVYETDTIKYSREKGFEKDTEFTIGKYCPICGKIGATRDYDYLNNTSKYPKFVHYEWSEKALKEFDPKTRTLPYFRIDQFKDKFVNEDP